MRRTEAVKRAIVAPAAIDFATPGRRDYFVRFEHPTYWGDFLVPVTVIAGREQTPGRGVVAIGATHGNEYEGPVAIKHLLRELQPERVRGRVILIPTLNVPAFNAGVRDTPEDGVNLNRAFPGEERGGITHRFAHFISTHIFPQVHVVIDIHSGGQVARFQPLTSFHHVSDLKQRRAMEQTARGFGSRFTMNYQNNTPGLLTSMAERMGKITIGSEFGFGNAVLAEGVSMARQGILTAAIVHEQLDAELPPNRHYKPAEQILVDNSELSCYVPAEFDSHFEPLVECGSAVKKSERIGFLHDFDRIDDPASEILAPHDGYVISQAWNAKVFRGQVVSVVSIPRPWMD
jgi:N-alpha-acetyl-L-2,4-diaminobutyrate deacetylase